MNQMRDAFKKAGYNPGGSDRGGHHHDRGSGGRPGGPPQGGGGARLPQECLLTSYYNEHNQLKSEIFDQVPKKVADVLQQYPNPVKASAMRKFYECVRTVRESNIQGKDFEACKPDLYRLKAIVNRQRERKVVSDAFVQFIEHNIDLAAQSPENLKGFHRLFESVICYSKEK